MLYVTCYVTITKKMNLSQIAGLKKAGLGTFAKSVHAASNRLASLI